ncbi:MAG: hypothetical protein ACTHLA_16565 [Asticcacaulis sp.]|uniref:hypothetical protein n=1 Tax=Asticcacaulis sp. TaxID=1872648 RepID=UPI003F7B5623
MHLSEYREDQRHHEGVKSQRHETHGMGFGESEKTGHLIFLGKDVLSIARNVPTNRMTGFSKMTACDWVILIAFIAYGGWRFFRAAMLGREKYGIAEFYKANSPVSFWLLIVFDGAIFFGGIILLGLLLSKNLGIL